MKRKTGRPRQLDLFVAFVGDVPFRDDREGMSVPLVSLSKGKRVAPIKWTSANGEQWVRITANATHGMGTIYDLDVVIWAVSQINKAVEERKPSGPVLHFQAYDMLRTIGRSTSGRGYAELEAALNRLAGTLVETNIRLSSIGKKASFHLLEGWSHITDDATGRSLGMTLTLPRWVYEGVVQHRDVLAVSPVYFDLTSGIARWLYRLARRHAGKQEHGWRFTMKRLHERSGTTRVLKDFAKDVRKLVEAQGVPEYRLDVIRGQTGEEVVVMARDPSRVSLPQRRDLASITAPPATIRPGDGHVGSRPVGHVGSRPKARGITPRRIS
jgi:plasmid replication initiation protein